MGGSALVRSVSYEKDSEQSLNESVRSLQVCSTMLSQSLHGTSLSIYSRQMHGLVATGALADLNSLVLSSR